MHTSTHSPASRRGRLPRGAALPVLCLIGLFTTAQAQFQPPPPADFDHEGWIAVEVRGVIVDGSQSTFQQRHRVRAGPAGGISSFYWETYPTRELTFQLETRSIFNENDHFVRFDLFNPDGGFLRGGFQQSRHRYDASGGYFPDTDLWFSPFGEGRGMHLDAGVAWIEVGVANPGEAEVALRYTHRYRQGLKDSTIWGRTGLTGGAGNRGIVPSFREIDETRHTIEGRASHTVADTDLGGGLRFERYSQDNTLNLRQFPTQPAEQRIEQTDGVSSDLFSANAWTSTQLTEWARFSTGYIYTRIDNDITGSRDTFDPDTGAFDTYFTDMDGWTQMRQHVANVNVVLTPLESLLVIPSARFEKQDVDALVNHVRNGDQTVQSERETTNLSQRLELRYVGIPRWRFFARGDWMQGDGDIRDIATVTGTRETELERRQQRYTLGANWSPHRVFSGSTQYYYSIRKNDYDHLQPGRVGRYPAFIEKQDFETHGFNVRTTIRPVNRVTLVSRYDLQLTDIDTRGTWNDNGEQVSLKMIQSGEMTRHLFSQSVTWTPVNRLYLQLTGNYAISRIETPANEIDGEAWSGRVLESKNDYFFGSLAAIYAFTEKTDFDVTYTYYFADNFVENWEDSTPYGVGEYEHGVRFGVTHRIHDNFVWNGGYGFYYFREDTTGGMRDYDAHLLYTGLTMRF